MAETTQDALRTSLKFSLWTWAAYWPGGGVMLLAGGMRDPVSIAIALLAVAGFLLVFATGALRTERTARLTARQVILERPIYLLVLLVLFLAAGSFVESATNIGFFLFSALYVGGIVLCMVRLQAHLRATGQSAFATGADQLFVLLGLVGLMGMLVFLDTFLPRGVGVPSSIGAILNWVQLTFPALLLLAARPFREKLNLPRMRWIVGETKPEPKPVTLEA